MRHKHTSRLLEWGKNVLIFLLALSLIYLLGRTQVTGKMLDGLRDLWENNAPTSTGSLSAQPASARVRPLHLAVYQDGLRYGIQYDQEQTDRAYEELAILIDEALSSVAKPEQISEHVWRNALCSTGIYLDFYYSVPFATLAAWQENGTGNFVLTGSVRRLCLAEDAAGEVSLFFINAEDGLYYSAKTTLSMQTHLTTAVDAWMPNGAQFAFEVPGLESVGPYTLLTVTPQPVIYASENPLLEDPTRVEALLSALSFRGQSDLDPVAGGQLVGQNDSLRLSRDGVVTFHTIGDSEYRFSLEEQSFQAILNYVQALAQNTVGAWCSDARLSLEQVIVTADQVEITFQYTLDGTPVILPEGNHAARFIVRDGAVKDMSLYLRTYTATEEMSLVMPVVQAAAAMEALTAQEKELTLLYRDTGGEQTAAGWIAVG